MHIPPDKLRLRFQAALQKAGKTASFPVYLSLPEAWIRYPNYIPVRKDLVLNMAHRESKCTPPDKVILLLL